MAWKSFASDNYASIHPTVLKAIGEANIGHSKAYGGDSYTQRAIALFKEQLGEQIDVYFVCTGTAANVLGLNTLAMAELLAKEIQKIPQIKISRKVQANAVFACLEPKLLAILQDKYSFYIWDEATREVRWMTSWDTTQQDILDFVAQIYK